MLTDIIIAIVALTAGTIIGVRQSEPIWSFFDNLLDKLYILSQNLVWRTALWQSYAIKKFEKVKRDNPELALKMGNTLLKTKLYERQRVNAKMFAAHVEKQIKELTTRP